MTNNLSLHNLRVMIPRGKKHAATFSKLVQEYGGIPVEIPLIAFRPARLDHVAQQKLTDLYTYDWIVFTSNVTVETFFSQITWDHQCAQHLKIATIGKKTKECLQTFGIEANFIPSDYVAEVFVQEFLPNIEAGTKVLIPKGNLAREHIASELEKHGAMVDELVVYETYFPNESRQVLINMMQKKQLHILTFTSPSTIDHFMSVIQECKLEANLVDCIIACIGPVTFERAKQYGLRVNVVPDTYTVVDMLTAVMKFIEERLSV